MTLHVVVKEAVVGESGESKVQDEDADVSDDGERDGLSLKSDGERMPGQWLELLELLHVSITLLLT